VTGHDQPAEKWRYKSSKKKLHPKNPSPVKIKLRAQSVTPRHDKTESVLEQLSFQRICFSQRKAH
jgi:hypothetical protein